MNYLFGDGFSFKMTDKNKKQIFKGQLESIQCKAQKKDGTPCLRKITLGLPFCYQHRTNLTTKKSLIPNADKGLFAYAKNKNLNEVVFKKKQKITEYNGEILTNSEKERRYGNKTAPYAIHLNKDYALDASLYRGIASFANTNKRSR